VTLRRAAVVCLLSFAAAGEISVLAQRGPQRGSPSAPSTLPSPPALPGAPTSPNSPAAGNSTRSRRSSRLFAAQDLGLLEGPDRDQWQKPEQIMDALLIADGSVVAELGAAGGWFAVRLARRVGPNGIVYAEDIQPDMIDRIGRSVKRENLPWMRPVLGTANDPRLPAGIDAVVIVGSFAEMELPPTNPVQLLKKTAESLKPDGRIGIVDFNAGGGGPGPAPEQRVDPQTAINAATAAGLRLIAREAVQPFQYLLVFGKGLAPRPTP
jgi:SAM-dependent methyltransferase